MSKPDNFSIIIYLFTFLFLHHREVYSTWKDKILILISCKLAHGPLEGDEAKPNYIHEQWKLLKRQCGVSLDIISWILFL